VRLQCYGDLLNGNGMLRGMEQTLVDLLTDEPAGLLLADRRFAVQMEIARRTLEAAQGGIDILWLGEDLGTQDRPMISMEIFKKHFRPRYQQLVDLGKAFDLQIMIHTCGSSSWAYEDFIDMGIDAVDTLQPEAKDMSPTYLKTTFGGRLAFHGCISTAGPVAFGSPQDVVTSCRETVDDQESASLTRRPVMEVTQGSENIFEDLGFGAEEAANITQPRISNLMKGEIGRFSVDKLIVMLTRAGMQVDILVKPQAA